MKPFITSLVAFFIISTLYGQDFYYCQTDLTPLIPPDNIDIVDRRQEFTIIQDHLPDYGSLHNDSATITWLEYVREMSPKELRAYRNALEKLKRQLVVSHGGGFPDDKTKWPWRINDSTYIHYNKIFSVKRKTIDKDFALFYYEKLENKSSSTSGILSKEQAELVKLTQLEDDVLQRYSYLTGNNITGLFDGIEKVPLFDLTPFIDYKWRYEDYKSNKFVVFNENDSHTFYCSRNLTHASKFLWKTSHVTAIQSLIEYLKAEPTIINYYDKTLLNPAIVDASYDFKDYILTIKSTEEEKEHILMVSGDTKKVTAEVLDLNDFVIYESECYHEKLAVFNSLTLPSDEITNPQLKQLLKEVLESSPEWFHYTIEKVILTSQSKWAVITNKYTGFMDSRFLAADVYVKSNNDDSCFLIRDVFFNQKADPIKGFIYEIMVAAPHNIEQYPCGLK